MTKVVSFSKILLTLVFLGWISSSFGQLIHSGEIIFKRRTNLQKRYEGNERFGQNKSWMKKPKFDQFVLYFNDSSSLFKPVLPKIGDEDREWSTMRNTTYQNFKKNRLVKMFSFFGASIYLDDTLRDRAWIITGGERDIAGYKTKQAMWKANDSVSIYAWFSEQIVPSVGPEDYFGLPGAILGLAIEDGGVVYFAEEVKPLSDKDFKNKFPKGKADNYYSRTELQKFMNERFVEKGFTGRLLYDFTIW